MAMSAVLGGRASLTTRPSMSDVAGGDVLQPGDHAQQRRLAAAGRADEDDELAVGDLEVDAVHDLDLAERLFHAAKAEARHVFVPPWAKR